jgi:hypothetical protein
MPEATEEEIVGFTVRFPKPVLDKARDQAKADRRSLNNEIVYLVSLALDQLGASPTPPARE